MKILFWISVLCIVHTFIIYPITLKLLHRYVARKGGHGSPNTIEEYQPTVSIIVAAYNEEKVIEEKLKNLTQLDYDPNKMEIIIASDNSTDDTNKVVIDYIKNHGQDKPVIILYKVKERKGKTNAQNQAVNISTGEILAFSDANTLWQKDALKKLIKGFQDPKVGYICGKLTYTNIQDYAASNAENTYWNYELSIRQFESRIYSITAGNGGIYAIRKEYYIELDPLRGHDGIMPTQMVLNGRKALFEPEAVAREKASQTIREEFFRKVRMARGLPWEKYKDIQKYNVFKYGWFSYFMFSHRYIRYSLYILHIILIISTTVLFHKGAVYMLALAFQILFYGLAFIGFSSKSNNKIVYFPYYYVTTITAQLIGVIKTLAGDAKPFWEKAPSTR